jgi:hypothetical protein
VKRIGLLAAVALLAVPSVASARRVATPRETTGIRTAILRDFHPGSRYRIHGYVVSTIHTAPFRYALVGYVATGSRGAGLIQLRRGARGWRIIGSGRLPDPCAYPDRVRGDLMPGIPCRPAV